VVLGTRTLLEKCCLSFLFLKYSSLSSQVAREGKPKSFPLLDGLKRQLYRPKNISEESKTEVLAILGPSLGGSFAMNFKKFRASSDALAKR